MLFGMENVKIDFYLRHKVTGGLNKQAEFANKSAHFVDK